MDTNRGKKIISLKDRILSFFTQSDWEEVGLLTGCSDIILGHHRLLRSLSFGDEDYSGNVLQVLRFIDAKDQDLINMIETYVSEKYPDKENEIFISSKPSEKKITFAPNVFNIPDLKLDSDLIALMMPFASEFRPVSEAIKAAASTMGFRCLRADDIWDESTIVQDIFNLIFKSRVVIADFTGKNPNVMYETGIAHTLGKTVIPITQYMSDIPFDMQHHRTLRYLLNHEGLLELKKAIEGRLGSIT
jgi:hypothetical protein